MVAEDLPVSPRRVQGVLLFLVAFLLWLLNTPYHGIWHDARVYALTVAHWLYPAALSSDLFFSFGSQASLTLFTQIYGAMVGALGLDAAARVVVLSGGMMWVFALFSLSRVILGDTIAGRFAVLFGAVISISYSPNGATFVINENFATARSWAMPLALMAVALSLAGRRNAGMGLAVFSTMLHPLLGIWAVALLVSKHMPGGMVGVLAIAPTLIALGIGFFAGEAGLSVPGLRMIDGEWLDYLKDARDILFKPSESRLYFHCIPLVILLVGMRAGSLAWRPIYFRLFVIGSGAILLALTSSYLYPLEIIVQGQPWRASWLLIPMAGYALIDVLHTQYRNFPVPFVVPWIYALILGITTMYVLPDILILLAGVILGSTPKSHLINMAILINDWRRSAVTLLIAVWVIALPSIWLELEIVGNRLLVPWWEGNIVFHGLVAGGSWHLPLVLAGALGLLPRYRRLIPIFCVLFAVFLFTTVSSWDKRDEAVRAEESSWLSVDAKHHPFSTFVQPGETVAWPARERTVWFGLHTASYWGPIQGIGAVFSREKFSEWKRRGNIVEKASSLVDLCVRNTTRKPDWVVMRYPSPRLSPVASIADAFLYSCHDLK